MQKNHLSLKMTENLGRKSEKKKSITAMNCTYVVIFCGQIKFLTKPPTVVYAAKPCLREILLKTLSASRLAL